MQWNEHQWNNDLLQAYSAWNTTSQTNLVLLADDSGDLDFLSGSIPDFDFGNVDLDDLLSSAGGMPSALASPTTNAFESGAVAEMNSFHADLGREWSTRPASTTTYSTPIPSSETAPMVGASTGKSSMVSPTLSQSSTSAKKRASPSSSGSPDDGDDQVSKRVKNTEAARRYRQRKVDRMTDLEEQLAAMTKERDDLRIQLARSEAEADVLRRLAGPRA